MKKFLDIVDPIHDFIRVYDTELKIIDSPIFQRLRRIRQLSGAHLTYPSAQHSRFEHSLGVMHIAGQAATALKEKGLLTLDQIQQIRLAALLHDVGHGPFSHLFEEVLQLKKKISHEEIGKKIIQKSEIADILSKAGFDKNKIIKLAFGYPKYRFVNEIISGSLSADMMDYLQRDGYFTGAEHAKIDHKRIIQSLDVYKTKLALEKSALYSFESMILSRYQMFKAVYFHKTVRSAEVMMLESIGLADQYCKFTELDLDSYANLTDEFVISKILSMPDNTKQQRRAKKFALDYQNRRLLKCVYEKVMVQKSQNTHQIREKLAQKSKTNKEDIFVDTSGTSSIPLTPAKEKTKSIILMSEKPIEIPFSKIPVVSSMAESVNILRIYTSQNNRNKVEMAAKSLLG
ncbi:MAG: HD domain-containing protein [Nitrososphaeria archaeon]|nr:HD domain-containing protein [Nitrososphaeria archaeon]NDB51063.1 HD domain-containing protein [Nitrosopumilaceae archaeon]NDB87810.1 HD domain-containing protein [Nitrososphaerota archaeon]NDB62696.1 HD domain-containing protein [Nitrosopumilaceae archaeon]NDB90331.1 HD domain-containing protein [Nitrososphaerota archaeon]